MKELVKAWSDQNSIEVQVERSGNWAVIKINEAFEGEYWLTKEQTIDLANALADWFNADGNG